MTYSIAQAERLTGIKAHTLRIWERRYDFLVPERTETNIRYFSDAQLRKLINVSILLKNNYRISSISKMSDESINVIIGDILSQDDTENEEIIKALILAMLEMEETDFSRIFNRLVLRSGLLYTVTHVVYPFLSQVGVLWGTNKVLPAQEHFASNLIRQKIISAMETLPQPARNAPKIVFFLLENESHEIGLLLGAFIAKDLGWRVYYLGQNVPSPDIAMTVELLDPDLLMTMFVAPRNSKSDEILCRLIEEHKIPLLYSGNQNYLPCKSPSAYHVPMHSPQGFISYLQEYKQVPAQIP
ncbi:MAG: MerR family transcriptional regulator [Flavobacteriaceae bacterium]|nr:MerR family transcriptional regulator [Flavobacteriaceae bacterium]